MLFDYERRVHIRELGIATGKPYLALVGNIWGKNKISAVGDYLKKSIIGFKFTINGDVIYPGKKRIKSRIHWIYTNFVQDFLLDGEVIRIKFDTDCKSLMFPIEIVISDKCYQNFLERQAKGELKIKKMGFKE